MKRDEIKTLLASWPVILEIVLSKADSIVRIDWESPELSICFKVNTMFNYKMLTELIETNEFVGVLHRPECVVLIFEFPEE